MAESIDISIEPQEGNLSFPLISRKKSPFLKLKLVNFSFKNEVILNYKLMDDFSNKLVKEERITLDRDESRIEKIPLTDLSEGRYYINFEVRNKLGIEVLDKTGKFFLIP